MFILQQKLVQPATTLAHCPTPHATAQTYRKVQWSTTTVTRYTTEVSSFVRKQLAWIQVFFFPSPTVGGLETSALCPFVISVMTQYPVD